jgi:hypothetical protein
MEYSCGVNVIGGGFADNATLSASGRPDFIGTRLSTSKVITPGQLIKINTTVENLGISPVELDLFMFLGDSVQMHSLTVPGMKAADMIWTVRGPGSPGEYSLRFFSSSGDLIEEELVVVESRKVEILDAPIPANLTLGDDLHLNLTLLGLEESRGDILASLGESDYRLGFILDQGEKKSFTFIHTPEEEGAERVNIVVLTEGENYEDGLTTSIEIVRERAWWESILDSLKSMLESLFQLLGMSS